MSSNLQLVSTMTGGGQAILSIVDNPMPTPGPDDVVVRIEAAPINPSDMFPLIGFADYANGKVELYGGLPKMVAPIPDAMLDVMRARLDQTLPVGNEGAGTVVAAGDNVKHMEG